MQFIKENLNVLSINKLLDIISKKNKLIKTQF